MSFLKKAGAGILKAKSILTLIEPELSSWEKARSYKTIHASMLTGEVDFCPREVALLDILKQKPKDKFISAALRVCFDQGDALHDMARDKWLRDFVVGDWECRFCGYTVLFNKQPQKCCPDCKKALWRYKEINLVSGITRASGSLDMILDFGLAKHTIVEVKTMDKDEFKSLLMPLAEHRIRTNFYMQLARETHNPLAEYLDTNHAKVFYISKGFGTKNLDSGTILPFKEFDVFYDEESAKPYSLKALAVRQFRDGTDGIPAGICPTSLTKRAQLCQCKGPCWSGDYPAGKVIPNVYDSDD